MWARRKPEAKTRADEQVMPRIGNDGGQADEAREYEGRSARSLSVWSLLGMVSEISALADIPNDHPRHRSFPEESPTTLAFQRRLTYCTE